MDKRKLIENIPYEGLINGTSLDVTVYYRKGKIGQRGYYLQVLPVTRENGMVSCNPFAGMARLLLATNRHSDKQFRQAIEMSGSLKAELIAQVLEVERKGNAHAS